MSNKTTLLNCNGAAEVVGLSPNYIRKLCANGKIKAEKIGTDWFIKPSALKEITRKRKPKIKGEETELWKA